jgi:transmembrane sensor
MFPKEIEGLVQKYLDGSATPEERGQLDLWYKGQQMNTKKWDADSLDEIQRIKDEMFSAISKRVFPNRFHKLIPNFYWYVAASLIFTIVSAAFFYHFKGNDDTMAKVIITPGTNGAILTLANGESVTLGTKALSKISMSTSAISQCGDSLLEYKSTHGKVGKMAYNTLTTPNGCKFTLVLSDGTNVYMNAGSTLQYPEAFTGSERLVKLTGEAYFKVVHNSKSPFRVQVRNQIIEDIGTSFNVNAYSDEVITSVTLIEGSAKVKKNGNEIIIKPGQKALTSDGSDHISVKLADIESDLAWRSDLFHFDDMQLSVALKQIARWYDLDIEYEGAIPSKTINGEIYRNMNGAQILTILKNLGVNFTFEGKKLTIKG